MDIWGFSPATLGAPRGASFSVSLEDFGEGSITSSEIWFGMLRHQLKTGRGQLCRVEIGLSQFLPSTWGSRGKDRLSYVLPRAGKDVKAIGKGPFVVQPTSQTQPAEGCG